MVLSAYHQEHKYQTQRSKESGNTNNASNEDDVLPPPSSKAISLSNHLGGGLAGNSSSSPVVNGNLLKKTTKGPEAFQSTKALEQKNETLIHEGYLLVTWPSHHEENPWQKKWCRLTEKSFVVLTAAENSSPEARVELFSQTTLYSFGNCDDELKRQIGQAHSNGFVLGAEKLCGIGGVLYCDAGDMRGQQEWVGGLEDVLKRLRSSIFVV